jgi:drug/metabolite transporter (DMT)-like permease
VRRLENGGGFAKGAAAVLATAILWGVQFPVAKDAFAAVDAYHVTAIRYVLGTALIVPLFVAQEGRTALDYRGRFWAATVFGLIGMCASPMLVFQGIALSRPEHAAVIVALQPSMAALADWVLRRRRPANFTLACVVIAFLGVLAVVTKGHPSTTFAQGELAGDLLILAGAACWVGYTMATESFRGWSALRFTTLTIVPGTIGCVIVTAALVGLGAATVPTWTELASVWWQLGYLVVFGIVVSMLCWNYGNQRIGALNTMLLLNSVPVVTFAVRVAQGHRFQAIELAGALVVIAALIANNLYLRRVSARKTTKESFS